MLKALSPPPPPSLRIKRTRSTVRTPSTRLQRAISGINRGLHKSKTGHRRATKTSFHDGDDSSGDDDGGGDDNNVDDDDVSGYNEYEYEYDDDDDDSHNHYHLQASSSIYPPT